MSGPHIFTLPEQSGRTFTYAEIAVEALVSVDVIKSWIGRGRVKLDSRFDVVTRGGRGIASRLHWRTTITVLLGIKLNDFGLGFVDGEAANVARGIALMLTLEDLSSLSGPVVCIKRGFRVRHGQSPRHGDRQNFVQVFRREKPVGEIEAPLNVDGFDGVGSLIIDPIGFGRIIWRMSRRQIESETTAEGGPADAT